MSWRRAAAGLAAAMLAFCGMITSAAPALALPGIPDCKEAPIPELPGRSVVGFFESAPDPLPAQADPFAANSTTTIHEQYGYAGLRWNTYDLGCGPDTLRSPDATMGTSMSNWLFTIPKATVAATGAVIGAAFQPDFLGVFDPLITTVVATLRRTVFDQWAMLVLAGVGFLVVWRSRRAPLASTTGAIGWAVLVMMIASVLFQWPLVAGHAADQTVTTTLGSVVGGLNSKPGAPGSQSAGTQTTGLMHEALLYQAWLGGQFGDPGSPVARKYGPAIFDSQAFTWREAALLRNDPVAGQKLLEAKRKKFTDTAAKIKTEDPDGYEYLIGHRSDSRVGYSLLALFTTICAVPFLLIASLLVVGALIIVRLGVMLFPAIATLGLFPTMRNLVIGVGDTLASAVINALVFGIGTAVMIRGYVVILGPGSGLAGWLDVLLMLLLTIVMWAALHPFRRLTVMVSRERNHFASGAGGLSSLGRGATRAGSRVITTATGTLLGALGAGHLLRRHQQDDDGMAGAPSSTRAEATTVLVTAPTSVRTPSAGSVTIGSAGPVSVTSAAEAGMPTGGAAATASSALNGAGPPGLGEAGSRPEAAAAASSPGGPIGSSAGGHRPGPRPGSGPAGEPKAVVDGFAPDHLATANRSRFESGSAAPLVATGVGTWRPQAQPSDRLPESVDPPVIAAEEYEGSTADLVYRPGGQDSDQQDAIDDGARYGR